jgi:hypothetical protein
MVIDASSSMAGPAAAPKINTVKTIVNEQVRDLAARPSGTEFNIYTFDAAAQVKPLQEGAFFANKITPAVNGLAANGADAGCPVPGLDALAQAAQGKFDGQAWLYTDGDSADSLYPEQMRAQFNEQQLRGSVVLLGGCGAPAREQKDVTGGERTYLSLAADGSQSSGIVPYLLTAVGTGGQFLYVAPDQLANAVDMVRAQLGHSAGAGRWSDYVSNIYTYRWDRLQPWEYEWVQVEAFGRDAGQLSTGSLLPVNLPAPFSFYDSPDSKVFVSEDGYLRVGQPCASLFCVAWEFRRVNALAGNLNWRYNAPGPRQDPSAADGAAEDGLQVHAYTTPYNNDWFIVSTQGTADSGAYRAFQTWLNLKTGEIRLQYDYVQNEAATAEIGLQHSLIFPQADVVVSKNRAGGAANGIGYKFTPAPPQPSKTYEVEVDPLIESVIFLQTGYSGDFAPLLVTWPDGTAVTCSESGVRCLTADNKPGDHMVQYVQVNTSGRSGLYKATVAVGPLGGGTYSFNALAASELRAVSPDRHTLPLSGHTLRVDLGRPTDDGTLQAWLQTPDGDSFGAPFTMYDDGNHADGAAGDGRFGSGPFTPPNAGAAYLWVYGATGGVDFRRSDPAPFNFQPLDVQAKTPYKEGYYGENVTVPFRVINQDAVSHCYSAAFTVPEGWTYSAPEYQFCVKGRDTAQPYVRVGRTLGPQTTGEKGVVTMTLTEVEAGQITGSAAAQVALFRPPVALEFDNRWVDVPLRPNGTDTADMTVNVIDDLGQIVGISGPAGDLQLSATLGTAVSPTGRLDNGRLPILYTAGNSPGVAEITLLSEGPPLKTTITLAAPAADTLAFSASPTNLADAPSAALLATVRDVQGNPVAGQTVRFSVSDDDGDKGTIAGGELWEGSTNSQGEVTATFVKADGASGAVVVRAELLSRQGEVLREESLTLRLSQGAGENGLYLPFIGR